MSTVDTGQESRQHEGLPEWMGLPVQRTAPTDRTATSLRMASIMIVDPDPVSRRAMASTLSSLGIGTVHEAAGTSGLRELVADYPPGDLALVSLGIGRTAPGIIAALQGAGWYRVVAMAPTADIGPVIDAVGVGVHGVLIDRRANPAAANVPASIHDLSAREIEVIQLVAEGRSNKWIGEQLLLSSLTVKSHLARIGRKLGTGDRAHIVAMALRAGVIS